MSDCVDGNTVLDTHKAHFLVGLLGGGALKQLSEMCDISKVEMRCPEFESAYVLDDHESAIKSFKRIVNYYSPFGILSCYLDSLISKYQLTDVMSGIYLNPEDIREIHKEHEVGSHGRTHKLLSRLNEEEQMGEIIGSWEYLNNLLQSPPVGFCYPFGTPISYNARTLKILRCSSYKYATSVEAKPIGVCDDIYQLPRYDCNMFESIAECL